MATFTKLAPRKSAGYSEPAVAGVDQRLIELTILRKTHHQLRDPVREIVSLDLPCMEGLAVATFRRKKPFFDDRATDLSARTRRQIAAGTV